MIESFKDQSYIIGEHPSQLFQIHSPKTNIVVYKRDIASLYNKEIKTLEDQFSSIEISGDFITIEQTFREKFEDYTDFKEDVIELLHLFRDITDEDNFRLLLTSVSHNMCTRFHANNNYLRLLCTYNGPGTLWLPNDNVDRIALNSKGSNDQIVLDNTKIREAQPGSVLILKGSNYPNNSMPVIHKSPEVKQGQKPRLLLKIDVVNASNKSF